MNQEMDAVYILSPQVHIVDCLMADLERRRYRRSYIIWTSCKDSEVEDIYASTLRASRAFLVLTVCSASSRAASPPGPVRNGKGTDSPAESAEYRLSSSRVTSYNFSRSVELSHPFSSGLQPACPKAHG